MLWVWFVFSITLSLSWLVYQVLYIHERLSGADFGSLAPDQMAVYAGLAVIPVWVIWQIFGYAVQFMQGKKADRKLTRLLDQAKKNQDYTDLIVRVMLEAEHEIKDGFVINKFDVFISDINEILADIVVRSNCASSMQLEQLWGRVKNGERWIIGKTLVEAAKRQNDFAGYLVDKASKDSVFKGTLLEFCARYQDLSALLEKHDRDRVFINIMETGVLGRVYALLAPAADGENFVPAPTIDQSADREESFEAPFADMPEPEIREGGSFWSRLNPFSREPEEAPESEDENLQSDQAFFETLQQNLNAPIQNEPNLSEDSVRQANEPTFERYEEESTDREEPAFSAVSEPSLSSRNFSIGSSNEESYMPAPSISDRQDEQNEHRNNENNKDDKNEDFAYPFGGWIDEKNYK